jgi:dimethylglycine dehydrogenase
MTGGLTMAGTPDRWEWLQSAYRVFQSIGIDDCRLVTPEEAGELNPIMSTEGFLGGMWADREGYLDTTGTVHAYAKAAKKRGASFFEHTKVESLEQTATAGRSSPTRARSPASTWSTPPVSGPSRWAAWRGSSCPFRR